MRPTLPTEHRRGLLLVALLVPLALAVLPALPALPALAVSLEGADPAAGSGSGPAAVGEASPPALSGIRVEFILFAATLLGVALLHHHTLRVALVGLAAISLHKILFSGFHEGEGPIGWLLHLEHEWVILTNLLGLLLGFGVLAHHFEKCRVPELLPRFLPSGWKGGFALLVLIGVLSTFLDNIAAAMVGGTLALTVFRKQVHIGYLAAIVAASNAGGAASVVGDTTTTMMWIDGVSPLAVLEAAIGSAVALVIFGIPAALLQHRHSPIQSEVDATVRIDWGRVTIVALTLVVAVATNVIINVRFKEWADHFPFIGVAVCLLLLASSKWRRPDWSLLPASVKGSCFLLSLVLCASMMPVEELPEASWGTALGLGFISAVFDNIPLTKLALDQGGYDWGFLAYAVGFGGSITWFGSSAGVALTNIFPEARSVGRWVRHGWFVAVAYVAGYMVQLLILGWHPDAPH